MPLTAIAQRWLPRGFGLVCLLWAMRIVPHQAPGQNRWSWAAFLGLWLAASWLLIRLDRVRWAAGVIAVLAAVNLVWPWGLAMEVSAKALLCWFAVILALTEGRAAERALLIRTCVSVVYAFAAVAKLNPAFLAGLDVMRLLEARATWLTPLADAGLAPWLAAGAVVVEGWLAIGLWFRRTRAVTAVIGVGTHVMLVLLIGTSWYTLVSGLVLNGLLVLGYLAFFVPVGAPATWSGSHASARSN